MLKLADFFGLVIDDDVSDISPLLDALSITKDIEETKVVSTLSQQNGRDAAIVNVARRQQVLKLIAPLLNEEMLDYDPGYYDKEITTSSEHDRRYGAEEKLLAFALIIAATKSMRVIRDEPKFPTVKHMREAPFRGPRFDKFWDLLADETDHIVSAFRKSK